MNSNYSKTWRWIALVLTITGIIVNYIVASGNKLSVVTARYDSLFVPAGYAFSIWGFIYTSVILYLVFSLSRKQEAVSMHERLATFLSLLAIGGMIWILLYTNLQLALSAVCIVAMLVIAMISLKTAYRCIIEKNLPRAMIIPFSLYAAWLMVASISNLSLLFKANNWVDNILSEPVWAIIMLIVSALLAIIISLRYKTLMFAAVVTWATIAIYIKQENEQVKVAALSTSIALSVFILFYLFKMTQKKEANYSL